MNTVAIARAVSDFLLQVACGGPYTDQDEIDSVIQQAWDNTEPIKPDELALELKRLSFKYAPLIAVPSDIAKIAAFETRLLLAVNIHQLQTISNGLQKQPPQAMRQQQQQQQPRKTPRAKAEPDVESTPIAAVEPDYGELMRDLLH